MKSELLLKRLCCLDTPGNYPGVPSKLELVTALVQQNGYENYR